MGLRWIEAKPGRLAALAGVCVVLASMATLASPANARQWRHSHHHRHYVGRQAPAARNQAFAAIVVDENSGRTLYAASDNELRHPASLTKVMTLYLLFEQLDKGRLTLASQLSISAHAAGQAPSKLGLDPGDTISVEDAIKAIVTRSANDIAVAVAENIGGDEEDFAAMMTRKARDLGMAHTTYVNASGLPDDRQITTARDLTLLGRAVEERFPRYFHYFSTQSFDFAGETIGNHNHLLGRVDGVDGIKTGYTRASGFNLLTSVHRGGRSLVAVVMGGPTASARDRFMEQLIGQHIASASTTRSATLVAAAAAPEPARVAAIPPTPPVKAVEKAAEPTPARVAAARSDEDAEGDGDNVERDAPEAAVRPAKLENRVLPEPPAPPVRTADASPAALGWVKGADGVPSAKPAPVNSASVAAAKPAPLAKAAAAAPAPVAQTAASKPAAPAKTLVVAAKEEVRVSRSEPPHAAAHAGWMIQLGATDDLAKANDLLARARTRDHSGLASAKPFTEKVEKDGSVFYRARFAGLDSSSTAETECRSLKRSGFSCFATHD